MLCLLHKSQKHRLANNGIHTCTFLPLLKPLNERGPHNSTLLAIPMVIGSQKPAPLLFRKI
ncbi:MAG: hypothetical protein ACR2MT_16885, partial [Aurantibacter sp.]